MSRNKHRNFTIPTAAAAPVKDEVQNTPAAIETISIEAFDELFANAGASELAAVVSPVNAAAWREFFYDDDGRMRTVAEVKDEVAAVIANAIEELAAEEAADSEETVEEEELEEDFSDEEEEVSDEVHEEPASAHVDPVREEALHAIVEPAAEVVEVPFTEKPVGEWTKEQLEQYIKGEIPDVRFNVLKEVIVEHQRRDVVLDLAWNPQQCKEFLTQGIVPEKTSKGAWKSDVTRFARKATQWTTQEIESWALGEIRAEGMAVDSALACELKERLILVSKSNAPEDVILAYKAQTGQTTETTHLVGAVPTAAAPKVDVEAARTKLSYEGLTEVNQTYIEETLKKYKEICAPGKPITAVAGKMAQKQLDNVIRYVINLEDPIGFKNGMEIIRQFITANRAAPGLFDDSHAFRFTDELSIQGGIQESHIQILTLFFIFADDNKEARTQYDVPSLVSLFPAPRQPLLLQYFKQVP